jgi:hypothetical protein
MRSQPGSLVKPLCPVKIQSTNRRTSSRLFTMNKPLHSLKKSPLWLLQTTSSWSAASSSYPPAVIVESLQQCLLGAIGGEAVRVRVPSDIGFESNHVRPYSLNYPWAPSAVTYPTEVSEVAKIVICASDHDLNVQARSGGHDYTNKCKSRKIRSSYMLLT